MPLTKLWGDFNALFSKKPDPRQDPEDKDAYDHFDKLAAKQKLQAKPVQILRDRGKPSDVQLSADDLQLEDAKPGLVWWVDVYEGPRGSGYQACYEVKRGLKTFRKVVNVGPEEEREQDWAEVLESPVV